MIASFLSGHLTKILLKRRLLCTLRFPAFVKNKRVKKKNKITLQHYYNYCHYYKDEMIRGNDHIRRVEKTCKDLDWNSVTFLL